MTSLKRPEFKLSGNVAENFKNFEMRFNDYCIQAEYRDLTKDPTVEAERSAHYIKPRLEIAAFRSALPDEALQVLRYTISPQIPTADQLKPWVWMDKLGQHYIGTLGSSLMADRFRYWEMRQGPRETVVDWEVKVRQAGTLCNYGDKQDEMCRDKFVFGLSNEMIRTELLKTHCKADGTAKSMGDVVSEAKIVEAATQVNQMITDTSKATSEQVNWTSAPPRANTQTRPGSSPKCGWCGGQKHARKDCPASQPGTYCTNCFMTENHFTRMCRSPKDKFKAEFVAGRPTAHSARNRRKSEKHANAIHSEMHQTTDSTSHGIEDDDEHLVHSFTAYSIANTQSSGDKYFTWLPVTVRPGKTVKILMQVDSAATCNTLPSSIYSKLSCIESMKPSCARILPYSGDAIRPIGRQTLPCEGSGHFELLDFEIISSDDIPNKPALLSGRDSERLGLVSFNGNRVFRSHGHRAKPAPTPRQADGHANVLNTALTPGHITKNDLIKAYRDNFEGVGDLGKPVQFTVDPNVTPVMHLSTAYQWRSETRSNRK